MSKPPPARYRTANYPCRGPAAMVASLLRMAGYFRRSLALSRGSMLTFFERPISGTLMAITIGLVAVRLTARSAAPRSVASSCLR